VIEEQEETRYITTNLNAGCEGQEYVEGVSGNILPPKEVEEFDMTKFGKGLRRPEEGIRCAGRKGTTRLLWLHEFYVVNEGTSSKPKRVLYQALQFLLGVHVPVGQVHCMTQESSRDIWVLGIRVATYLSCDEVSCPCFFSSCSSKDKLILNIQKRGLTSPCFC
jgi:hypothetical protein